MTTFISVDDARSRAQRVLPAPVFDYVDGGSDDERTLRRNRDAYRDWSLRQSVGVDVGPPDTTVELLGMRLPAPIVFSPCGLAGVVHPEGELALAEAAGKTGALAMFSTFSNHPLDRIAAAATGPAWFQLYFLGGRDGADRLVDQAEAAGYDGLVLTLDTTVVGKRERDLRHRIVHPVVLDARNTTRFLPHVVTRPRWLARFLRAGAPLEFGNLQPGLAESDGSLGSALLSAPPTWHDVERYRKRWDRHLVVKGILEPADACRAIDLGADAVVVSNHGGRQLDGAMGTLDALADIVAAVDGRVPVIVDGGVRRGTDVVKALALGASAVGIGRPYLYGLAVGGAAGIGAIWSVLVDELARTMRLVACRTVDDIGPDVLRRVPTVAPAAPAALTLMPTS